jgi:uncharacterized protein YaeQ
VVVVAYGARRAEAWWVDNAAAFARLANLSVFVLSDADAAALQSLAARSIKLTCTLQEGHMWLATEAATVEITPERKLSANMDSRNAPSM